jgi:long-subunit fatty acid transport protein
MLPAFAAIAITAARANDAGAGFTWHFTPRCHLDIGYRYLHMSDAKINNMRVYMDNLPGGADHIYFCQKEGNVHNFTPPSAGNLRARPV